MNVAILEDDDLQNELFQAWLREAGYSVTPFDKGEKLLDALQHSSFDAILVDWELPDISGLEVVRRYRRFKEWNTPILFITSRHTEEDIVEALKAGADDYMTKPPRRLEMLARLEALLRRAEPQTETEGKFEFPPFTFDTHTQKVAFGGQEVQLTNKEFELILYLFRNKGRLLSRGHILEQVWGQKPDLNTRTVDTHISLVRQKLNLTPENGWRLSAIYGHGYRLEKLSGGQPG